jgi:hypothetical protein
VTTPSALLKVMIDAVRKTARGLTRDFGEVAELQVSKGVAAIGGGRTGVSRIRWENDRFQPSLHRRRSGKA